MFRSNRYLLLRNEYFIQKGYKLSHIYEMNVTTISNKKNMTIEFYIKQTMQMVEMNLNKINYEKRHLANALDRNTSHPSLTK